MVAVRPCGGREAMTGGPKIRDVGQDWQVPLGLLMEFILPVGGRC